MSTRILTVNLRSTTWRVRCCDTFLQRARGLIGAPRAQRRWIWRLHPCRAVHTLFMAEPVDVVFCDREGRVLRIVAPLPRRRWAGHAAASSAWEFPAGATRRLQLRHGDWLGLSEGATTIEFTLALVLGVLPLVLGVLQVAMLLASQHTVSLATFLAARQGAVAGADRTAMSHELARGLLPLYVRASRDGITRPELLAQAYAAALADVGTLDSLVVHNPTRSDLDRYGRIRDGRRVLPNDYIEFRPPALRNANVLSISVVHCQPLIVPLAGPALATTLQLLGGGGPRQETCLAAGRAPLLARASVVMQSDLRAEALR
jgi:uncharacterized membrane protein (UPF0127 family)